VQITPVSRRRLYQKVSAHLERMIGAGALAEGELLPSERDLMEQFQVGRPAIREALLSLQQKGLIHVSNGERARVCRPDAARLIDALSGAASLYLSSDDGVRHFQATRMLFEAAATAQAARVATEKDLERIGEALEANRQALSDRVRFQDTDVAFHLQIVLSLQNPLLTGIHEALSEWLTQQRAVSLAEADAAERAFDFHERIFAALIARSPETAEALMKEHLKDVEAAYWRCAP